MTPCEVDRRVGSGAEILHKLARTQTTIIILIIIAIIIAIIITIIITVIIIIVVFCIPYEHSEFPV